MTAFSRVELSTTLPPLYAQWMTELLEGPVLDETLATCDRCAMDSRPGASPDGRTYAFKQDAKCCTYFPTLPNFTVGLLLSDETPEMARGRETMLARMARGDAVTPAGVGVSRRDAERYGRLRGAGFGQDPSLLCPYFQLDGGGTCRIWRYRNSTCSTYFCKFVRGAVGRAFWRENVKPLLAALERGLARWALLEVGLDEAAQQALFPGGGLEPIDACDGEGALDAAAHRRAWGAWHGREEAFFRACGEKVACLPWSEVLRIGGAEVQQLARQTRLAHARLLAEEWPETLAVGSYWVVRRGPETSAVYAYSPLDLLELPSALIPVLGQLNGRRTAEVLDWLAREKGITLEPALLRRMFDCGLLRDPAAPAPAPLG